MARKNKAPAVENHERWLISYADFITLLFAFFVVMFASSQADKAKAQLMSDSFREAIGTKSASKKGAAGTRNPTVAEAEAARSAQMAASLNALQERLKAEIASGMLKVTMEPRGIVISLRQAAFFPSGQDTIESRTLPTVKKIAEVIMTMPNKVRLEGHTDDIPIHTVRFRSNWELSSARSVTMLEILTERFQVPESRLSVGGYADTIPIASNSTEDGRAKNRRVDVVILNEKGSKGEPEALK